MFSILHAFSKESSPSTGKRARKVSAAHHVPKACHIFNQKCHAYFSGTCIKIKLFKHSLAKEKNPPYARNASRIFQIEVFLNSLPETFVRKCRAVFSLAVIAIRAKIATPVFTLVLTRMKWWWVVLA